MDLKQKLEFIKQPKDKPKAIMVRMTNDMHKQINDKAKKYGISVNWLVVMLLEDFIGKDK
jgi:predicted HicB family RNase H-like nuclease